MPSPTSLPVEATVPALRDALRAARAAVLVAPPGAGKTTVVPLRLLDEPWLRGRSIVMLEPRRLAARASARRMAALLDESVGDTVGFRTRDERRVGPATRIEVVTDGILTRRLQRDPELADVGLVIVDEVHERNLQADLTLAFLLDVRSGIRPDLRLLAMSATIDTVRVASLLGVDGQSAPVVSSDGRTHPVDLRWRPPGPRERSVESVATVVHEALATDTGDVLVFLPGAAAIRRVGSGLAGTVPDHVDVHPLFGALTAGEQDRALAPSPAGRRRVVLSTDIAETSLTVDGVRIVVDAGEVRTPTVDTRTGLGRLRTGPSSRASADQRSGRAGRTEPGVAYRLWSPAEHTRRREFTTSEIMTADLAQFALDVAEWGAGVDDLTFLDAPPIGPYAAARSLLTELGALDAAGRITPAGRSMSELPIHPRLARMVVDGRTTGRGGLACALAALLDERDVFRGRPDELPVDLTDRVRLVVSRRRDPGSAGPIDRSALDLVRRRARELARRAGARLDVDVDDDLAACGALVALAYPDRIAQARGDGRFRMRHGAGGQLPVGDSLSGEEFLVVASVGSVGDGNRIELAAPIDRSDVEAAGGRFIESVESLTWDPARDDLRRTVERRLGAIVLSTSSGPARPGDDTCAALVEHVASTGLGALRWTDRARSLQRRVIFAHRVAPADWPDLSNAVLLADLTNWLGPMLVGATGRKNLERVDVRMALANRIGHHRIVQLDRLLPAGVTVASGRRVPVDYSGDEPSIAVRAQELYGTTVHPTVMDGRTPLVVHLLSPAGRPIQVTADLPGFWAGSWSEVRKDMAGRYPKHSWPADPSTAAPGANRRRQA